MSSLTEYIKDNSGVKLAYLPLFHSCSGVLAQKIFKEEELKATFCKVFKKNLLYYYYGKPAYPVSEKHKGGPNRTDSYMCPVCFIVNLDKVKAYEIYPFDTGAFMRNLYSPFSIFSDVNELKSEYALGDSVESIRTYISAFFSDNSHYLTGEATEYLKNKAIYSENDKQKSISEVEPSLIKLLRMINCDGEYKIDERSRTIEVISDKSVEIVKAVEAVILPNNLLDDKYVNKFFEENREIVPITYCFRPLTKPDRYYEAVFQKAMDYLSNKERAANE